MLGHPASLMNYALSLHDALPICFGVRQPVQAGRGYSFSVPAERMPAGPLYFPRQRVACTPLAGRLRVARSEEHTSELQSRRDLVCRLLLEKKKLVMICQPGCLMN